MVKLIIVDFNSSISRKFNVRGEIIVSILYYNATVVIISGKNHADKVLNDMINLCIFLTNDANQTITITERSF